jgi:hypothetical protein
MTEIRTIRMESDSLEGLGMRDEITIRGVQYIVTEWEWRPTSPKCIVTLTEKTDFVRHHTHLTLADCDERVREAVLTSPTCALVAELARRTGVQEVVCPTPSTATASVSLGIAPDA